MLSQYKIFSLLELLKHLHIKTLSVKFNKILRHKKKYHASNLFRYCILQTSSGQLTVRQLTVTVQSLQNLGEISTTRGSCSKQNSSKARAFQKLLSFIMPKFKQFTKYMMYIIHHAMSFSLFRSNFAYCKMSLTVIT